MTSRHVVAETHSFTCLLPLGSILVILAASMQMDGSESPDV